MPQKPTRCQWATTPLYEKYHDEEWGVPCHDDRRLFEMLLLEGFQAGLSWLIILNRRQRMRKAFDDFDPAIIQHYDAKKIEALLQNSDIIRNRLKVNGAVANAKAYFKVCQEFGSLDNFFWRYVNHKPVQNNFKSFSEMPATTPLSDQISKDMKKLGFKFVGSTVIYAHMQATGMVNDHLTNCPCHKICKKLA